MATGKPTRRDRICHYVKTCVFMLAPVPLLRTYRIDYGRGQGIGYPWIARLVIEETCETAEQLHRSQRGVWEMIRNVPAPWEIESLFYTADSGVPKFTVQVVDSQSSKGHRQQTCHYGPSAGDAGEML